MLFELLFYEAVPVYFIVKIVFACEAETGLLFVSDFLLHFVCLFYLVIRYHVFRVVRYVWQVRHHYVRHGYAQVPEPPKRYRYSAEQNCQWCSKRRELLDYTCFLANSRS